MSSIIHSQVVDIPYNMTTTGFDVPGFRIVDNLGVVRGVVVRSRSVFGTVGASLQTLLGGNISLFTELAERTRKQAFDTMLVQAHMAGADAVIGIRYDANELMKGVTEVLCYGDGVRVEPLGRLRVPQCGVGGRNVPTVPGTSLMTPFTFPGRSN